jgi:hypothetical protein
MVTLTGQSCRALVAQALLVFFNCVQRCQGSVTAVASGCGLVGGDLGARPVSSSQGLRI